MEQRADCRHGWAVEERWNQPPMEPYIVAFRDTRAEAVAAANLYRETSDGALHYRVIKRPRS